MASLRHMVVAALLFLIPGVTGLHAQVQQPGRSSAGPAVAGIIPSLASDFNPAALHNWQNEPATFELVPQAETAPTGKVWVRKNSQGLIIAGTVMGRTPQFPVNQAEVMKEDHIEIWLAIVPAPELPEIGWGNQFQDIELPKAEESCGDTTDLGGRKPGADAVGRCRQWVQKQKSYRPYFKRLFVRQWQLAPGLAVESFAAAAYQTIEQRFSADKKNEFYPLPELLKPHGLPQSVFKAQPDHGYDFEVLVPWSIFPPSNRETVKDLHLMVEAFAPAAENKKSGPYASTAPGRRYGQAATFNRVRLQDAQGYSLTPCQYELRGLDIHDELTPAYFFLSDSNMLSDVFILENYKAGYAYEASGLSPGVRPTHFFWKQLGEDEYVCGPMLQYKKRRLNRRLEFAEHGSTEPIIAEDEKSFEVRRRADGEILIREGPSQFWSKYGSGQCGACPRVGMSIYLVDAQFTANKIFEVFDVINEPMLADMDIQVSPQWTRIAIYRCKLDYSLPEKEQAQWDDAFYCLKNESYEECAPRQHKPAPEPRTLKINPD